MYTLAFQDSILQWVVQRREGLEYVDYLTTQLFDLSENQIVLDLLQAYRKTYRTLPRSEVNLMEFFDREVHKSKSKIADETYRQIGKVIRKIYEPYQDDDQIVKETIIEYRQLVETKDIFKNYAGRLDEGLPVFRECYEKMGRMIRLSEQTADNTQHRGGLLLAGWKKNQHVYYKEGTPIFLHGVNKMTAAGGFYSPQLIIFMGGPKSFKTGFALTTAMYLVKSGLNVYYVDTENGKEAIKARFLQSLVNSTRYDLKSAENQDLLEQVITKVKYGKADFVVDFYPAHSKSTDDVENNLSYYKEEFGFEPNVIIWDNPDNMIPCDKFIKEKRLKIQHTYFDIINLQAKHDIWGIGLSQVNKAAVNKEVINMKDFAEDFGKAMNCHAAFALCATEEEIIAGIRRIVPVVQREGVPAGTAECFIEIDAAKMTIAETNHELAALLARRRKRDENEHIFSTAEEEYDSAQYMSNFEKANKDTVENKKLPARITEPDITPNGDGLFNLG